MAYIENMEDVLATYEKPYDPTEPVVCLDEKPVPLHAEVRPPSPAKPGNPRNKTTNMNAVAQRTYSAPSSP